MDSTDVDGEIQNDPSTDGSLWTVAVGDSMYNI